MSPGMFLGSEDRIINKINKGSALMKLTFWWEK